MIIPASAAIGFSCSLGAVTGRHKAADLEAIAVVGVGKKDPDHHAEIYKQLETLARGGELAATVLKMYRSLSIKAKP